MNTVGNALMLAGAVNARVSGAVSVGSFFMLAGAGISKTKDSKVV